MEVSDLYRLGKWFDSHVKTAVREYQMLQQKLQHNATQPKREPVKPELNQLLGTLRGMPMYELTGEQISVLEDQGIDGYIGPIGARNLESIVKSARFDPASANEEVQSIHSTLNESLSRMNVIKEGLSKIAVFAEDHSDFDQMMIRIHFKESASISDLTEWKTWSEEWLDIIRGVALCVDEAPENVKVLGARQGSIILVLGATAAVTSLLLLISNHLTKIALNGLQLANAVEDFKSKVKVNKTVISGLEKAIDNNEKDGIKDLLEAVKKSLPAPINGEQENALKKSIEKYQVFLKKGGELDALSPPPPEEAEEDDLSEAEIAQITEVRENIEQLREVREETKLLTAQAEEEDDFEDEDLEDNEDES